MTFYFFYSTTKKNERKKNKMNTTGFMTKLLETETATFCEVIPVKDIPAPLVAGCRNSGVSLPAPVSVMRCEARLK